MSKTSAHYLVNLAQHARRLGIDIDAILQRTGIPRELIEEESKWIDNSHLTALIKALWSETRDESMGFEPDRMLPGSWALSCEYMLAGENLDDLYRRGERVMSLLRPDTMNVRLSTGREQAVLELECYIGEFDADHFFMEFWMVIWHRFPNWAIDENIQLQHAGFTYPRPAHALIYEELFQCDVDFDQPCNSFTFNRRYLRKPIARSKSELQVYLRDSPAGLLYLPGRETSVQSRIKAHLMRSLRDDMRFPAFEGVCSSLCMSSQVIRRRLTEEGTSYQRIKDAVRCELVRELLANRELAIGDIAERAGFAETAALSRAFKKWVGKTPAQFRKRILTGQA